MDLSFAKDPKIWSQAVETLRQEREEMSEENLKAMYEKIAKGTSKKTSEEEAPKEESKKTTKKADKK